MKYLHLFLSLGLLLGLCAKTYAQGEFIQLTERNSSGKKRVEILQEGISIVDVNSTIELSLNLKEIEREILLYQGLSPEDSNLLKLQRLNEILEAEIAITAHMNSNLSKHLANPDSQLLYFTILNRLGIDLLDEIELDESLVDELDTPERERAFLAFNGGYFEFLISFVHEKAEELRGEILENLGLSGADSAFQVYFRLGAFLRDRDGGRPIHVENFDKYNRESYQEIGRFGKPISPNERKELQRTAKLNNELGGNITQSFDNLKGVVKGYKKELFAFREKYRDLDSTYTSNLQLLRASPKTLPAADVLMNNSLGMNQVEALYATLFDQFDELARLFSADLSRSQRVIETLDQLERVVVNGYDRFEQDVSNFNSLSQENAGKEELRLVSNQYKTYADTTQQNVGQIKQFIQKVRNAIRPFRKSYLENENFSDKVNRFQVGKIPATGLIELNYIGTIEPGDEILIKATLERGIDRENRNFEEKSLFRKVLKLQRINPYIRMSGSIIMANPYTRQDIPAIDLENNFQFAPTYGIILKWGSRKNTFYNKFVNLGVGFAFSSPDFNTDGTPEFGAGIMLTAFRDIISVGWGRNFGLDAPYTFIGFNIPFSIGGLPGDNSRRFDN